MSNLKLALWSGLLIRLLLMQALPAIAQSALAGTAKPTGASQANPPAQPPNANAPAQANQLDAPKPTPKLTQKSTHNKASIPVPKYLQDVCTLSSMQCVRVQAAAVIAIAAPLAYIPADCAALLANSRPAASASTISGLLTNVPAPFSVAGNGSTLTIYSTRPTLSVKDKDPAKLAQLEQEIGHVATLGGFQVDLQIPHASTLGSLANSLSPEAPSGLTVIAAGSNTVRLTSDGSVSCSVLKLFLNDVARFSSHTSPDSAVTSVFFVDPAATANTLGATAVPFALGGAAAPASAALVSAAAPTSSNSPSGNGGGNAGGNGGSPSGGATLASTSPSPSSASTSPMATVTITQGSSTIATPSSTTATAATPSANPASGSSATAAAIAPNGTSPSTTTTIALGSAPSTPPGTSSPNSGNSGPSSQSGGSAATYSVNGRDLYFPEGTPGDDGAVTEKKRIVALLDLPQPQVLVNAWVMQSSTARAEDVGRVTTELRDQVNQFNDVIQASLNRAWLVLRRRSVYPGYFDTPFHDYLTLRTVLDGRPADDLSASLSRMGGSNSVVDDNVRRAAGLCPANQYCLGFTTLFDPVQPRLTDMLIAVIAASDPAREADCAVDAMEAEQPLFAFNIVIPNALPPASCGKPDLPPPNRSAYPGREAVWNSLALPKSLPIGELANCQVKDELYLFQDPRRFPLECFRYVASSLVKDYLGSPQVSPIGPVRAALADFLFNYKLSQEFPHEFTPYDLTMSAQALDSATSQFIHAFNEDLQAFQAFMRASWIAKTGEMRASGDKSTFLNDGIVTVQTTSGDLASVQTGTQSFLNTSRAPEVYDLFNSILKNAATPTGVLANISGNEAQVLMGALAAYQTTYLNVNRQLNLVVRPRSLLGASAAEMDVQLDADQGPTSPNYWTAGPTGPTTSNANLSQVTQHDTATHVRVDSIKLFEVSSFYASLSKGRDKFPLLPPFVEIPYIGTLAGIPLKAAREFHTSSAIVSAVIVPTATDIAYSLRFTGDSVVSGDQNGATCEWPHPLKKEKPKPCKVRRPLSYYDLGEPVREFHRMKLHCLATMGDLPVSVGADMSPGQDGRADYTPRCRGLNFSDVLAEASSE